MKSLKSFFAAVFALAFAPALLVAAPAAPTGLTATTDNTRYIYLEWEKVDGAAYYVVYRYGGNTEQIGLVQFTTTELSYADVSCEAGATIPYRVRAFDADGNGGRYSAYVRGFRKVLLEPDLGGEVSINPLGTAGVATPLKVRCNYRWQASADSWIQLHNSAFQRSNDATNLEFTLTRNDTGAPRTGTITLKAGRETATLKVVQGAVEVPDYSSWCGDSQYAILEDAALAETFKFMTPWPASFVSVFDDTAVGGSCLKSMPVAEGGRAVATWSLPENWRLRFSWRKDTDNANDKFMLCTGDMLANGKPDLANARVLQTCTSTEWTTVTLDQGDATTNLFFVVSKSSGCTPEAEGGCGYLDNFLLQTAPQAIRFVDPPVKYDSSAGTYTAILPNYGSRTVAAEVTFGHTVTLGGETRPATGLVYPTWTKLKDFYYLKWTQGTGNDAHLTTFTYDDSYTGSIDVRASYTIGSATASQILTLLLQPSAFKEGLDTYNNGLSWYLSEGSVPCEWQYVSDASAYRGNAAWSGTLTEPGTRTISVKFSGNQLIRFSCRRAALAADESFAMSVDGLEIAADIASDDAWHTYRLYVPDAGEHELVWTFAKTGDAAPGDGVKLDDIRFDGPNPYTTGANMLMRSAVFGNAADTFGPIYVATPTNEFTLVTTEGAEWIDTNVRDGDQSVLTFGVAANDTGDIRSGQVRLVSGAVTNYIRVVQSATASAEVSDFVILSGKDIDVAAGEEVKPTASFTLGGQTYADYEALDFYCGDTWLEGGAFIAADVDNVISVDVSADLGVTADGNWNRTYAMVSVHPSPAKVLPAGMTIVSADGWWVQKGTDDGSGDGDPNELYLQTDTVGNAGTAKTLAMTVTGPGLFTCQGKAGRTTVGFYLDIIDYEGRQGGVGGWSWGDGTVVVVPEGVHAIYLQYEKQDAEGTYNDVGALRRLTWTPTTFAGAMLEGATDMASGGREIYQYALHYTNVVKGVGADVPVELMWEDEITLTATDARTTALIDDEALTAAANEGALVLNVPLTMSWSDTLTLSVTPKGDGAHTATIDVTVTPTSLSDVLDTDLKGFTVPNLDTYATVSVQSDLSAIGGTCLQLLSESYYSTSQIELTLMDKGTLTFNYQASDALTVTVDGVETTYAAAAEWTTMQIDITTFGPHRIVWSVVRSSGYSASACLDNLQWRAGEKGESIRAEIVHADSDEEWYQFNLVEEVKTDDGGTEEKTFTVYADADSWTLTRLSGDPNAAGIMYQGDVCSLWVEETITNETTYTLSACYTCGGVTYNGSTRLVFSPRMSVEDAIFDAGRPETVSWCVGEDWVGTFDDSSAGTSCARSKAASEGDVRDLYAEFIGKGTLEFDWKVSGAAGNMLAFCTNSFDDVTGEEVVHQIRSITSPVRGWQHATVEFGDDEEYDETGCPKRHNFFWRYMQATKASAGDFGFIDNVTWSGTTPLPIAYSEVTVTPNTLAPGESATASIVFYRESKSQSVPATGSDVPVVESWEIVNCDPAELASYVQVSVDRATGVPTVSVDPTCSDAGCFYLVGKYKLYGEDKEDWGYVEVTTAPKITKATLSAPAMKAMAANGVNTVGQCLVAGLDPDDENAQFTVNVTVTNGTPYISWSPNLPDREYILWGKTNLMDSAWVTPTNSAHRFFKVEVRSE